MLFPRKDAMGHLEVVLNQGMDNPQYLNNREYGVRKEVSFDDCLFSHFVFADLCSMKSVLCQPFATTDRVNSSSESDCLIGEQSKMKYKIARKERTVNTWGIKKKVYRRLVCK